MQTSVHFMIAVLFICRHILELIVLLLLTWFYIAKNKFGSLLYDKQYAIAYFQKEKDGKLDC